MVPPTALLVDASTLTVTAGTVEIADNRIVGVDVTAAAASHASNNAKWDEHIASSDFLDVANHPVIGFHTNDVVWSESGGTASGSIAIRGITSPIAVTISNVHIDGHQATFDASARVNRVDLGIDKMPSFVVGAHLDVTVSASASRTD